MTKIACAACGNDGSDGALYLTIDARWQPESATWELRANDNGEGIETPLDCLECDAKSAVPEDAFPYDVALPRAFGEPGALAMIRDALDVLQPDGEEADALRLRLLAAFDAQA